MSSQLAFWDSNGDSKFERWCLCEGRAGQGQACPGQTDGF